MYVVYELRLNHTANIVESRLKISEYKTLEEANEAIQDCMAIDREMGADDRSYTIIMEP